MRYGVIGGRTFIDFELMKSTLDKHFISEVVSGGAKGADTLAREYANLRNIKLTEFYPDYVRYGKKAPFVRNKLIVNASDVIVAFWDGKSTGTNHSIEYARSKKIKVIIIDF
jgi:predicted Rossmann fold nucleotide-binding protein DprA/Smf involved in DNA uptake